MIDASTPDIVAVNGANNGVWQNTDAGPVISWTNPNSPSGDTYYITNDGSAPSNTNYAYTTQSTSYDLPNQKDGETIISVRDLNGAGTYSTTRTFTVRYDSTAPANVSNLVATATNSSITLNWKNPIVSDFNKVIIIRNNTHSPSSISDGTKIFDGNATSFVDFNLPENTKYYYTLFALDNLGNQSSGATITTITSITTTQPTTAPATTSDTKIVTVQNLTQDQKVNVTADNNATTTTTGDIHVYTDQIVNIEVPAKAITSNTTNVQQVLLVIQNQAYEMSYDTTTDSYKVAITAPAVKGAYDTRIQTVSDGSTKDLAITMSLKVDPYGYIYTKTGNDETRISNATVTLYKKEDNNQSIWKSTDGTPNPETTNTTGEYQFYVEPGEYKIVVEANGYITTDTGWFTVEGNTIQINIELKKETSSYLLYGLAGGSGLVIVITIPLILRKRKSRKKII
jgi:hypothetical protein